MTSGMRIRVTAYDATRDETGPEPQPQVALTLRPWPDRQRLHSLHVLGVVPAHLLQMSSDQDAPAGLGLTIEAVDLECRVALADVESGARHRAYDDVLAVDRVVDGQDHRRRADHHRHPPDLDLQQQPPALVGFDDLDPAVLADHLH